MCLCIPKMGVQYSKTERTPLGPRLIKKTSIGYTGSSTSIHTTTEKQIQRYSSHRPVKTKTKSKTKKKTETETRMITAAPQWSWSEFESHDTIQHSQHSQHRHPHHPAPATAILTLGPGYPPISPATQLHQRQLEPPPPRSESPYIIDASPYDYPILHQNQHQHHPQHHPQQRNHIPTEIRYTNTHSTTRYQSPENPGIRGYGGYGGYSEYSVSIDGGSESSFSGDEDGDGSSIAGGYGEWPRGGMQQMQQAPMRGVRYGVGPVR